MRILGIDPGIGTTGWAIVEPVGNQASLLAAGIITTLPNTATSPRLLVIHQELRLLLEQYAPDELAIEKLFFAKNVTTGMRVSEARGVILLSCAQAHLVVAEYTPPQVKQAVTGYGNASKRQVIDMLHHHLIGAAVPTQDDAADAIAVAVTHLAASRLANSIPQSYAQNAQT